MRPGLAFVRTTLANWQPDADTVAVDDAMLVTAELLANATAHAGRPLALQLYFEPRTTRLRIEVTDPTPTPPRLRLARPDDPHGHGLRIVDRITTAWGTTPTTTGKTVWAELLLPAAHWPGATHAAR
ncbi:ATP-binding protein [Kitasatospora sp. NPDC127111]|uniref:ATP-binding protein n=1 Tax=Kitasatospora sp. NPDC127111 TaxID=3345363 RepID=UPI0036451768